MPYNTQLNYHFSSRTSITGITLCTSKSLCRECKIEVELPNYGFFGLLQILLMSPEILSGLVLLNDPTGIVDASNMHNFRSYRISYLSSRLSISSRGTRAASESLCTFPTNCANCTMRACWSLWYTMTWLVGELHWSMQCKNRMILYKIRTASPGDPRGPGCPTGPLRPYRTQNSSIFITVSKWTQTDPWSRTTSVTSSSPHTNSTL